LRAGVWYHRIDGGVGERSRGSVECLFLTILTLKPVPTANALGVCPGGFGDWNK
jgi:hypothetical protein